MNTTSIGKAAEVFAANNLSQTGYKIVDTNWRTRICEIDIIAQKKGIVYFCEVKFRKSSSQGEGLDYITPKKLRQLRFAAEVWCAQNKWEGDYQLLGISVGVDNGVLKTGEVVDIS